MKEKLIRANQKYTQKVQDLLLELNNYSEQQLNHKINPKSWSALQIAHHLILSETSSLAYVKKKLSHEQHFHKVGIRELYRSLLIRILLYQPFKFKAPAVVGDAALPTTTSLEEIQHNWMRSREEWQLFFDSLPNELTNKAVFKHPRAGRIGWIHLIQFFGDHFSRHLLQMKKTLRHNNSQ